MFLFAAQGPRLMALFGTVLLRLTLLIIAAGLHACELGGTPVVNLGLGRGGAFSSRLGGAGRVDNAARHSVPIRCHLIAAKLAEYDKVTRVLADSQPNSVKNHRFTGLDQYVQ